MKPNPRIAINALTLPRNLAGTGFYTRKLIEHLVALRPDLEITLFTNRAAAEGLTDLKGLQVHAVPAESIIRKALWSQVFLPFRLSGFDLLHSVGNVGLLYCPIPQIVTIYDMCQRMVPDRFTPAKRAYLNAGQTWSAWTAAKVITTSEATRKDLLRYHPGYGSRAVTIHCASKYGIDRTDCPRKEGFLFVGTLEPGKRLESALEALARLKVRHGVVKRLAVVGAKGWRHTHLPDLIRKLGVEDQVDFLGYLSDEELRQRYRSAECLIFPSVYEGFGLPILEAQSQGCLVVSADNSSLQEVGGDASAHYFPTHDLDALTAILLRSQRDPEGFRALREAGYANCLRFDWKTMAERTLEVYRGALQKLD